MNRKISLKSFITVLVLYAIAEVFVGLIIGDWTIPLWVYFGGLMFSTALFFGWGEPTE